MSFVSSIVGWLVPDTHAMSWGEGAPGVAEMWQRIGSSLYTGTAINNPVGIDDPVYAIIFNVINFVYPLIGAVAVLVAIYGGILMVTAQGKDDQINKGKTVILYACAGVVLGVLANAFITFLAITFLPLILS